MDYAFHLHGVCNKNNFSCILNVKTEHNYSYQLWPLSVSIIWLNEQLMYNDVFHPFAIYGPYDQQSYQSFFSCPQEAPFFHNIPWWSDFDWGYMISIEQLLLHWTGTPASVYNSRCNNQLANGFRYKNLISSPYLQRKLNSVQSASQQQNEGLLCPIWWCDWSAV